MPPLRVVISVEFNGRTERKRLEESNPTEEEEPEYRNELSMDGSESLCHGVACHGAATATALPIYYASGPLIIRRNASRGPPLASVLIWHHGFASSFSCSRGSPNQCACDR